jgi:hypothetical protein
MAIVDEMLYLLTKVCRLFYNVCMKGLSMVLQQYSTFLVLFEAGGGFDPRITGGAPRRILAL